MLSQSDVIGVPCGNFWVDQHDCEICGLKFLVSPNETFSRLVLGIHPAVLPGGEFAQYESAGEVPIIKDDFLICGNCSPLFLPRFLQVIADSIPMPIEELWNKPHDPDFRPDQGHYATITENRLDGCYLTVQIGRKTFLVMFRGIIELLVNMSGHRISSRLLACLSANNRAEQATKRP